MGYSICGVVEMVHGNGVGNGAFSFTIVIWVSEIKIACVKLQITALHLDN